MIMNCISKTSDPECDLDITIDLPVVPRVGELIVLKGLPFHVESVAYMINSSNKCTIQLSLS